MATTSEAGLEALHRLRETDPAQWLAGTSTLTQTARAASRQLFSSLRPFTPKSPFDQLLVDGFDAEQIWQQIDLQTQPLLSNLRRELKRFEKNPEEIGKLKLVGQGKEKVLEDREVELGEERDGFDEELDDFDVDDDDDDDDDEEDEEEGGEERESEREEEEEEGNGGDGIEDKFLKIKDLEDFLEDDEAREYGLKKKDKKKEDKKQSDDGLDDEDEDEDEEEDENAEESEDEEDEDSDEDGEFGFGDDEEEETDELGNARYEDFFGGKKKKPSKKSKLISNSENSDTDDQEEGDKTFENQKQKNLSKHEKDLKKLKSEIDQMEKANLEPKDWTMQGEVTAAKRPKNSALEVDLDFEHNVRPPPVITEEITESIEKMIQRRIARGLFDDVQKAPTLPSKAPKEFKELDENKSKKGLAEVYEEKYFQETNAAYAPTSFTDELKKEASELFKKLCLKLDALSHFHFTPKPVIEDMAVQVNVPALAMEEIAPVAVSDAAMLAPEEVFAGKGDVKEDAELTQADRKRRRAKKKRKFKADAAKRMQNKGQDSTLQSYDDDDKEDKKRKL